MRFRLLNTDADDFPFDPELQRECAQLGLELLEVEGHTPEAIAAVGARCDGLLVYRARIDEQLLALLPRCRVVARCGTGYEHIDVDAARRRGIVVTYVPDFCAEEMSDLVLLFVLAFARGIPALRRREWAPLREVPPLRRLQGRRIGILGFGSTGRRTAAKAAAIGMRAEVWTRTPRPTEVAAAGAVSADFDDVCSADFVSLHLPLTPTTEHLFGRDEFESMVPGAVLINTARGRLVDTDALVDALRSGHLGGAGLDVTHPEPLPSGHPLWTFSNVFITSHTGSASVEALRLAMRTAALDAAAVLNGNEPGSRSGAGDISVGRRRSCS
jgi:phosphoglycerate dehydrogenase-like enzyme